MSRYLFLLLLFWTNFTLGQKFFAEQGENCFARFLIEDEETYIHYSRNDSIISHFFAGLTVKDTAKLKGIIMFQVAIDTSRKVCCLSYQNASNLSDRKLNITERIKSMQGWITPLPLGDNTCFSALFKLFITPEKYTLQRIGYNRNKGKHELESLEFSRIAPIDTLLLPDTLLIK